MTLNASANTFAPRRASPGLPRAARREEVEQ